ncbi:MAG: hypothetical protein ACI9B8_002440 [Sulfitobacter sp.]
MGSPFFWPQLCQGVFVENLSVTDETWDVVTLAVIVSFWSYREENFNRRRRLSPDWFRRSYGCL